MINFSNEFQEFRYRNKLFYENKIARVSLIAEKTTIIFVTSRNNFTDTQYELSNISLEKILFLFIER